MDALIEMEGDEPAPTRCERIVEFIMFRFRWLFVVPFLLPLSFLFNTIFEIRNRIVHSANSAPGAHLRKVQIIKDQIDVWINAGKKTKLVNARPGWLTMSFRFPTYKENCTKISTDILVDILDFDPVGKTVTVEPGVTMGQLSRFLIPKGYTLPVLPELDDLTVGGLINGCGVESGSFKYGMFQHICLEYEILNIDGTVEKVWAPVEKEEGNEATGLRAAKFYTLPWSQGTIAFLTAAKIRIIPCKKFVKITYKKTNTLQHMCKMLNEDSDRDANYDFVEALQFNIDKGCVMLGEFSDGPGLQDEGVINPIGRFYKKWFYTHVEDLIDKKDETVEYIPLRDYYHRHSRSIFWELRDIVPFGNNVIFRYLMGWMCPPKIAFLKATTPNILRKLYDRSHVLQDMLIPLDDLQQCIELFDREVEIYPLWLCPFHLQAKPGLMGLKNYTSRMYIDVGAYGVTEKEGYHHAKTTRRLESFVSSVNGFQMTYADVYMTRDEHQNMFDRTLYDYVRSRLEIEGVLPDVYDKISRSARR